MTPTLSPHRPAEVNRRGAWSCEKRVSLFRRDRRGVYPAGRRAKRMTIKFFEFTGCTGGDRRGGLKGNVMVSERAHTDDAIEFIRKIAGEMSALPYDKEHQGAFAQAAALHYAANLLADRLAQIAEAIAQPDAT
jgi:hypothetical protein